MLPAASIVNSWETQAKLSCAKLRFGATDIKRTGEPHGAAKTPERPLGDVKRRLLVWLAAGSAFVAGDQYRIACDDYLDGLRVDPHQIDNDLQPLPRFHDIERDLAFRRMGVWVVADELLE